MTGGTATAGTDYEAVPRFTLLIAPGQTTATEHLHFEPLDDVLEECDETVLFTGTGTRLDAATAMLTIRDNDVVSPAECGEEAPSVTLWTEPARVCDPRGHPPVSGQRSPRRQMELHVLLLPRAHRNGAAVLLRARHPVVDAVERDRRLQWPTPGRLVAGQGPARRDRAGLAGAGSARRPVALRRRGPQPRRNAAAEEGAREVRRPAERTPARQSPRKRADPRLGHALDHRSRLQPCGPGIRQPRHDPDDRGGCSDPREPRGCGDYRPGRRSHRSPRASRGTGRHDLQPARRREDPGVLGRPSGARHRGSRRRRGRLA